MLSTSEEHSAISYYRQPALFCVTAFACGIFLDRYWNEIIGGLSLELWLCAGSVCLAIWKFLFDFSEKLSRRVTIALFGLLFCSGGAIHHLQWYVTLPENVSRFAGKESSPIRLVARIESDPVLLINKSPQYISAWRKEDKTRCTVRALQLIQHDGNRPVSGKVLLTISGDATFLQAGDHVSLAGKLRSLSPALNPAGLDYSKLMRQRGISGTLFCSSPEAVQILSASSWSWPGLVIRPQQNLRRSIRSIYFRYLGEKEAGIANALLLGERNSLEEGITFSFRRSGLMHLLSISGLHVGLIGWLCLVTGRLLNLSQRSLLLFLMLGITLCLILAEVRPPVLRAWLIGVVFIAGWAMGRQVGFLQSLGLAAWLILIINPAWLFDRGTQLSFLAMLGLYGLGELFPGLFPESVKTTSRRETASLVSTSGDMFTYLKKYFVQSFVISLTITVLAIPLLANSFSRVTLAGIPATIFSLPILAVCLFCLLLLGFAGMVNPILADWFAVPASFSLNLLHSSAEVFSSGNLLQWPVCRPDDWFLAALYAVGAGLYYFSSRYSHRHKSWMIAGWLIAILVLVDGSLLTGRSRGREGRSNQFECRVLAVGHGNACLLKCPNGKTILIDAGSMENGQFAASVVRSNLADMDANRLDVILLSHTDLDHINAVPFLIEQLPVREILLNPVGLNPQHSAMHAIASQSPGMGVKLKTVCQGDCIELDRDVTIRIRQCPDSPLEKTGNDNADSIVAEVEYRNRRLLFPGDLEDEGQTRLMRQRSPGYDVLLAPHHGGKHENTPEFSRWVNAKNIVVSTNSSISRKRLESVYGPGRNLYFTSEGAIRIRISQEGRLVLSQWQPEQFWKRK